MSVSISMRDVRSWKGTWNLGSSLKGSKKILVFEESLCSCMKTCWGGVSTCTTRVTIALLLCTQQLTSSTHEFKIKDLCTVSLFFSFKIDARFKKIRPHVVSIIFTHWRLVCTYVCVRKQVNWKYIHSGENLCNIRCTCETPPLCNILVQNLPGVCLKNVTSCSGFLRDRMTIS